MNATTSVSAESLLEHRDFVRGLARSLLFDDHQVDDVVQQTWLSAMRGTPQEPGAVRSFLAKVVRSRASNMRRDEARLKRREAVAAARREPRVPSAADVVEREATRSRVVQAVLQLEEPYRSTVLLRYFENQTPTQIAKDLSVPAATVRTRLRRGLDQLRVALDERHGGERQAWCVQLVPLAAGYRMARSTAAVALQVSIWVALLAMLIGGGAWTAGVFDDQETSVVEAPRDPEVARSPTAREQARTDSGTVSRVSLPEAPLVTPDEDAAAVVGFRGRLLLPDGVPAPGRAIRLLVYEPNRLLLDRMQPGETAVRGLRFGRGETITSEDGTFAIHGLWPHGHYILRTDARDGTQLNRVLAKTPGAGEQVDLGDLVLIGVGTITGSVVDSDGEPVAGALVWGTDIEAVPIQALLANQVDPAGGMIINRGGQSTVHLFAEWTGSLADPLCTPHTRTDQAGEFTLAGVIPGIHVLVVQSDGHEVFTRTRLRVRAGKTRKLGKIRLRNGEEIIGRVVDSMGKAVPGAQVVVAPRGVITRTSLFGSMPQVDLARRPRQTDANGEFTVPGLPRAHITIGFRRGIGDPWVVVQPPDATAEHELRLPDPVTLRVRIATARKIQPSIKLMHGRLGGEMVMAGLAEAVRLDQRLRTVEPGTFAIDDLVPGDYTLVVTALDHALTVRHVRVPGAETVIDMAAAQPLAVHVLDSAGKPLADASVFLRPDAVEEWATSLLPSHAVVPHWDVLPNFSGKTDAAGRVVANGVANGTAFLTVVHPRFGMLSKKVRLPAGEQVLRFAGPAFLTGQVMDGAKPADPGKWALSLKRMDGLDKRGPDWMQRLVQPGADGSFAVGGLTPGHYKVEVIPSPTPVRSLGTLKTYVEGSAFGIFGTRSSKDLVLVTGRNPGILINANPDAASRDEPGARVGGTVFVDGRAAEGCQIVHHRTDGFLAAPGNNRTVVDAGGRFELGRLAVGRYEIRTLDGESRCTLTRRITVRDGSDQTLAISIQTGVLTGRVTRPDGRPGDDSVVELKGAAGANISVRTDAAGRSRAARLPAGKYVVLAVRAGTGRVRATNVMVTAGQTAEVALQLVKFVSVRGRVDVESLGLVKGGSIQINLWGLQKQRWVHAEPDGSFVFDDVAPGKYDLHLLGMRQRGKVVVHAMIEVAMEHRTLADIGGAQRQRLEVPTEGLSGLRLYRPR